jgi:hypothetical protein
MRGARSLFAVGILVFAVSCGTTKIGSEYDKKFDYSTWKTFGWLPPHGELGEGSPFWPDVKRSVEEALAARGMRPARSGPPDFLVSFFNGSGEMTDVQVWGYYYGVWWTANPRILNGDDFTKGVVVLDLVDAKSKQMVWRGGARKAVSSRVVNKPDEMLAILRDLLPRILRDFPPKPAR